MEDYVDKASIKNTHESDVIHLAEMCLETQPLGDTPQRFGGILTVPCLGAVCNEQSPTGEPRIIHYPSGRFLKVTGRCHFHRAAMRLACYQLRMFLAVLPRRSVSTMPPHPGV